MAATTARLRRVVILVRDVRAAATFYTAGLGLRASSVSETHARLSLSSNIDLELTPAQSESQLCTGYSPLLTLEVDDLDALLPRALAHGGALDGAIIREPYGASAALRAPDGTMIGLHERAGLPGDGDTAVAASKVARARLEAEERDKS